MQCTSSSTAHLVWQIIQQAAVQDSDAVQSLEGFGLCWAALRVKAGLLQNAWHEHTTKCSGDGTIQQNQGTSILARLSLEPIPGLLCHTCLATLPFSAAACMSAYSGLLLLWTTSRAPQHR